MKRSRLPSRLALAWAVVLLPALALAQSAPVIQISGGNFRPMPVAITAPQVTDAALRAPASEFDESLTFDLTASGLFQVLNRKSFLADPKEGFDAQSIQFPRWADVGAEALVKTRFERAGDQVRGELRLFTVGSAKQEFQLAESAATPRALAHLFADALYKHFTREPGPFQSRLAFVRKAGQSRELWVADWDGRNARAVATQGINVLPSLGANGAVVFTSYASGHPDIVVWRDGKVTPLVKKGEMATGGALSPDGTKLAYALSAGESSQIWVANADGSGPRKLTDTPYFLNTSPSWSPDGRRLAFVSNRGGSPQIYVMNAADGSGVKRLTFQGKYNTTPDWSPRGDLIAFTARDEKNAFDIFTVHVDTGKVVRLTQGEGNNESPNFSPNGRLIVFTSTRAGGSKLFVMTADGNNPVALPAEGNNLITPTWAR